MKTKIIPAILVGLLASTSVFATNYYVNAATGADGNPGTQAAPFRHMYQIQQTSVNPGDNIYFARGMSYDGEYWEFTMSGTAAQPITITSYGSGSVPEFTNEGNWYAIRLTGDHLILDGVRIRNTHESGAVIWGNGCVIQNCEITDTGFGISIGGRPGTATMDARATGNTIHDLHMVVNTNDGGQDDAGAVAFNIIGGTDGADVGWNRITHCIAPSYDFGTDGGAFELYGNVANVDIHHNWCDDNNGVFEVGGGAVSNVRLFYNLCDNNGVLGGFHLTGTFTATISNFRFENNTVVDTASGVSSALIWFDGSNTAEQFSVTNNIFHFLGFTAFANISTFAHSYNLYWGSSIGYTPGATEIVADPGFVNLSAKDYRLQSTSPAVNAGTNLGYTYDRLANPITNTPDLGAFESPY